MRQDFNEWRKGAALRKAGALLLLMLAGLALAACNSGSLTEGLRIGSRPEPPQAVGGGARQSAALPAPVNQQPAPNFNNTVNSGGATTQIASAGQLRPVAFLPVSNAPQSAVSNLARSIRSAAAANRLPVVASVSQGAAYQVKGYFSALEDGSGTLLVYVWDVLDSNNKRVYRINGQEQTSGKSADPWNSVTPQMLDRVAQTTVTQLRGWLASRS